MSSKNSWSYVSSKGYSITEDSACDWRLKKNSQTVAKSKTPYPVIYKALNEKLISLTEALEIANILQIPPKYIDSSLDEQPTADTHSYSDLGGFEKY